MFALSTAFIRLNDNLGGTYGFVRACIGPFFGYLVGCCEALEFMAYVVAAVIPFGEMLTLVFKTSKNFEPFYWFLFFSTSLGINIIGGKFFWMFVRIISVISLLLLLLYLFATFQFVDFNKFAVDNSNESEEESDYHFSGTLFMKYYPLASWLYIGVEALPLVCVDARKVNASSFFLSFFLLDLISFFFHFSLS